MQKWEYLTIQTEWDNETLIVRSVNGQNIGEKKGIMGGRSYPVFESHLSGIGEQGWELVTGASGGGGLYVFKRPKT